MSSYQRLRLSIGTMTLAAPCHTYSTPSLWQRQLLVRLCSASRQTCTWVPGATATIKSDLGPQVREKVSIRNRMNETPSVASSVPHFCTGINHCHCVHYRLAAVLTWLRRSSRCDSFYMERQRLVALLEVHHGLRFVNLEKYSLPSGPNMRQVSVRSIR